MVAIHRCPKCSGQIPTELCLNARAWESCSALQHLLDDAVERSHFLALLDRWNLRYELQGNVQATDSLGMEVTPKLPDISFDVPKIEVLIFDDANRPSRMTCKLLEVPQNALIDACCLANAANNRWEGVRFYVDEGHMVAQSTVPFTTEHGSELLFDALIFLCDVVGDELPRMVDCIQGQALDQTSR